MNITPVTWASVPVRHLAAAILVGSFLLPAAASANLLNNAGFDAPILNGVTLVVDTQQGYGQWIDVNQWQRVDSGGNWIAQHITDGNNTNLLFQGFDATGLAAGTTLNINFDYIFQGGDARQLVIYGLNAGEQLSPNAPWPAALQSWTIATSQDWTSISRTFTLGDSYAALAIGFIFGSSADSATWSMIRAVDNVSVSVPTPGPLALFGVGLILLGMSRNRRAKALRMA